MGTMLRRAGQLTTRATAYVDRHYPVLLFVVSSVYAPRPVPVRVAAV